MNKGKGKLLVFSVLLLVLLLGEIEILLSSGGKTLILQLFGFLVLLILMLIGFSNYSRKGSEKPFFFLFSASLLNLMLLWHYLGSLYITLLLVSLLGFFISFPKRRMGKRVGSESKKEVDRLGIREAAEVNVTYDPGKYVASKNSDYYHAPKCDWAKKIKKERQVWFKDLEEAKKKGYRAHECAK